MEKWLNPGLEQKSPRWAWSTLQYREEEVTKNKQAAHWEGVKGTGPTEGLPVARAGRIWAKN